MRTIAGAASNHAVCASRRSCFTADATGRISPAAILAMSLLPGGIGGKGTRAKTTTIGCKDHRLVGLEGEGNRHSGGKACGIGRRKLGKHGLADRIQPAE